MGDRDRDKEKEPSKHDHGAAGLVSGKEAQKSALQKALGVFVKEDLSTIKGSIVNDYIEPNTKKLATEIDHKFREFISDTISSAVDLILWGKIKGKKGSYRGEKVNYTYYYSDGGYYSRDDDDDRSDRRRLISQPVNRVKRIVIPSYGKAEEVLRDLNGYISKYNCVAIGTYYQLVEMPTNRLDFDYGWMDLVAADIVYDPQSGGYVIEFPKPIPLD